MKSVDQALLTRGLAFALEAHAGQTRKGSDVPYVSHLLRVAGMVLENGGGVELAVAGMLHDAIEDCDSVDRAQIEAHFGSEIGRVVAACTDTAPEDSVKKKSPWIERKRCYLDQIGAAGADVHLVVACDKLDNLQCLVVDLQDEGVITLERFSASPRQTRWYYESVRDLIAEEIPGGLLKALDRSLASLCEFIAEASPKR